jgi:membrane glycosyltransferase
MTNFTFPPPRNEKKEDQKSVATYRRVGIAMLLLTMVLYSAAIWYLNWVLERAGAVDWRFEWMEITTVVAFATFIRIWDRAFMRPS